MENNYSSPLSTCEKSRLEKLYAYKVATKYERSGTFQHVASMAARIFQVPIALVNFVEEDHVKIEASIGVEGVTKLKRTDSLCSLVILNDDVTVFENARKTPMLSSNSLVHGNMGLQFYAGAPIKTADGYNIGSVSIADYKPRQFSEEDAHMLKHLANIVIDELDITVLTMTK